MPSALISDGLAARLFSCRRTGTPEAALPCSSRTRDNFPSDDRRFHQVETDLSHDGLNPAHVPLYWASSPTLGPCCRTGMGRADIAQFLSPVTRSCRLYLHPLLQFSFLKRSRRLIAFHKLLSH